MKQFYPYQQPAFDFLRVRRRALLQIPAGGGKTFVACAALNAVVTAKPRTKRLKIGWLAPTEEIRDQGEAALLEFPALQQQDIRCACPHPALDMSDRDIVVVDECKHATAPMWKAIIEPVKNRWGLDATPFGDDEEKNAQLMEMFGEIYTVKRSELGKALADAHVVMLDDGDANADAIQFEIERQMRGSLNRAEWVIKNQLRAKFDNKEAFDLALKKEMEAARGKIYSHTAFRVCIELGVFQNGLRNDAVVRMALKHKEDSTLVLVNKVEHAELLAARIPQSAVLHSKVAGRRKIVEGFQDGRIRHMIATSICDEGFDAPRANVMILASAGRSDARTEQRTGRVLRSFHEKTHGTIYDFTDVNSHRVLQNQSKKRQALYQRLNYQIVKEGELL